MQIIQKGGTVQIKHLQIGEEPRCQIYRRGGGECRDETSTEGGSAEMQNLQKGKVSR